MMGGGHTCHYSAAALPPPLPNTAMRLARPADPPNPHQPPSPSIIDPHSTYSLYLCRSQRPATLAPPDHDALPPQHPADELLTPSTPKHTRRPHPS